MYSSKSQPEIKRAAKPKIVIVLGPTASGKSDLAVEVALHFNGEVISADSRQVYKGLDIGSGKITPEETRGIPHHLLDVVSPAKIFTASDYSELAKKEIKNILGRGKLPVICGGTGFYINALLYGNSFAPVPPAPKIRKQLEKISTDELAKKLAEIDPERFASIDAKNRVRLIRALEIVIATGRPVAKINPTTEYDTLKVGILWNKEDLDRRIELRLDHRLNDGMIEEVGQLKFPEKGRGLSWKRLNDLGLEYRFISLYLKGDLSYDDMRTKLATAIKQYARRQMTWFRRDKEVIWLKPDELEKAYVLTEKLIKK